MLWVVLWRKNELSGAIQRMSVRPQKQPTKHRHLQLPRLFTQPRQLQTKIIILDIIQRRHLLGHRTRRRGHTRLLQRDPLQARLKQVPFREGLVDVPTSCVDVYQELQEIRVVGRESESRIDDFDALVVLLLLQERLGREVEVDFVVGPFRQSAFVLAEGHVVVALDVVDFAGDLDGFGAELGEIGVLVGRVDVLPCRGHVSRQEKLLGAKDVGEGVGGVERSAGFVAVDGRGEEGLFVFRGRRGFVSRQVHLHEHRGDGVVGSVLWANANDDVSRQQDNVSTARPPFASNPPFPLPSTAPFLPRPHTPTDNNTARSQSSDSASLISARSVTPSDTPTMLLYSPFCDTADPREPSGRPRCSRPWYTETRLAMHCRMRPEKATRDLSPGRRAGSLRWRG